MASRSATKTCPLREFAADAVADGIGKNHLEGIHKEAQANNVVVAENGNFGDCRFVGGGVWEQKIDWGPGYRVYYAIEGKRVVLLCDGGDKRTQDADIERAIDRWNEWQQRSKK